MDIKDRIKLLMEHEQMTSAEFAYQIGFAQATRSHTLGERNKYPSTDFIMKLHDRFSYISLDWLLTGKGNMVDSKNDTTHVNPEYNYSLFKDEKTEIPHNPFFATENRKEIDSGCYTSTIQQPVIQKIEYKNIIENKISEIRIYFDDKNYQKFKLENKVLNVRF